MCERMEDEVGLMNCGVIPRANGKRRVRLLPGCVWDLCIDIQDVPSGDYTLRIDGVDRGTISVGGRLRGRIEFDTSPAPGKLPLDFDPLGSVDIVQGGSIILCLDEPTG